MIKAKLLLFFIIFLTSLYSNELKKVTIKLGWKYQFEFAGYIAAKEKGFYKEVGLDVSLEELKDGSDIIDEVLQTTDIYGVYPSDLLIQKSKNRPIVLLSNYFKRSALIFVTKQNIFTPNDLIGKKVMITRDELKNGSLAIMLKKFNISANDIVVVPHTYNTDDFVNSNVDAMSAFVSNQPYILDKLKKNYNIIDPTAYGIFAYNNNLFAPQKTVNKNFEITKKLIEATNRGWEYALKNKQEIIDIIYSKYSQKKSLEALEYEAKAIQKLMMPEFYKIGSVDREFVENSAKILINAGLIDNNFSLEKFFFSDEKFLENSLDKTKELKLTKKERDYLEDKKVLKACINPDWMPIEGVKEDEYSGIGSDFIKIFSKKIDTPIKIIHSKTYSNSLTTLFEQKCDIMPLIINSNHNKKNANITSTLVKFPLALATKNDIWFFDSLHELSGKTVIVRRDFSLINELKLNYPKINFITVENINDGLKKVSTYEAFGYIDALFPIAYEIQNSFPTQLKIGGKFKDDINLGVGSRVDEPILDSIFKKVVNSLSEDEKEKILNKWLTFSYKKEFDYYLMLKIVLIFILILFFLYYRNRQLLKHQIELDKKNRELEVQKEKIDFIAYFDNLTKLPNRLKFLETLSHAIKIAKRYNKSISIFFIDLDRFKIINDTLGHHLGDEMLKIVAKRIKSTLREADTLARLGGDEFVLLLETITNSNDSAIVAQKILNVIKEPMKVEGYTLNTTASIGIAIYPKDGKDCNTLIKNADSAMYLAKDAGKNNYKFFTKKISYEIKKRLTIENALRDAIKLNEFYLLFQPKYDLATRRVVSVEALIRWDSKSLGVVSPADFIPIAEDSGYISNITDWVLINASKEFLRWKKLGFEIESIAINISSVEFNKNNIVLNIKNIIHNIGIEAKNIELEITERYIMNHTEQNLNILQSLRDLGFKISVDDFGTGYSSMSYLKILPLDTIKIDRSFIKNIPAYEDNMQITKAIVALSKNLGYRVIAEGIETKEQEEFLLQNGCDLGQGYYFSKPLSSEDFIKKFLPTAQN